MVIEMEDAQIRLQLDIAYSELRSQFIHISKPHLTASKLNLLKLEYSGEIHSVRTCDYINSIEALLRILEKRGVLSYNNIEVLKHISDTYVRDSVLERALRNYEGQRRPVLPPHNRYLMQGGEYSKSQPVKLKTIGPNQGVIPGVNRNENDIENESINRGLKTPATNRTSVEDLTISEYDILVQNTYPTILMERKNVVNDCTHFAKMRRKICSRYCACVMGALIGATSLTLFICISNIRSVDSSAIAPPFEGHASTSRFETNYNNVSQLHRQPVQMTIYTTQPAFGITLPGSINVDHTTQSPRDNESEVMRIVFQEISEKLGKHWRNVARLLPITEHDIDEINELNLSLSEKALKALLKFQSKCDPLQWKAKLKAALDKARRRDLMELVDELSSRRY